LKEFESIQVRKISYDKPIAIVINKNSGKKIDEQERISTFLNAHKIPHEFFVTQKAGDSFEIPLDMSLEKYSALVACGGDGTVHEVVNGMLAREDGLRVPIGVIPNGSGNGLASGLGMRDSQLGLEGIASRYVAKMDVSKVIADAENDVGIPLGREGYKKCRYALLLTMFSGVLCELM
jgi:diacylglycerol kinase family enzyme